MARIKLKLNLIIVCLLGFVLYFRSLINFFTNDDFFLLKISQARSLGDFLNFFNLVKGPEGLAMYRPLSTQVYYYLGRTLSGLNPIGYRLLSFAAFFMLVFLVYLLAKRISGSEKMGILSSLLYTTSATHFGHLYYSATFQELALGFFFLSSTMMYIFYLEKRKPFHHFLSLLFFILALMSKETAVVLPVVYVTIYLFKLSKKEIKLAPRKFLLSLSPYLLILAFYFYMRFNYYGFATGDSYIWNFSPLKAINTLGWYGLWSLNLPEMLVDFVGPGLKLNPNLLAMWSRQIIPIFILFGLEVALLAVLIVKNTKKLFLNKKSRYLILFLSFWFVATLLPVVFLPIHKFTFYLTVPLFGVVLFISYFLLNSRSKYIILLFMVIWLILSVNTLNLTVKTHWVVSGAKIAERVYEYFQKNDSRLRGERTIVFYDEAEDKSLPWSPTAVLKNTLSDNNFFKVFYGEKYSAVYGRENIQEEEAVYLRARQFLGY